MRETGPVRTRLSGDTEAAQRNVGRGRVLLGKLKGDMVKGGLSQSSRTYQLEDGTNVSVRSAFGQDSIEVYSPPGELNKVPQEGAAIPEIPPLKTSSVPQHAEETARSGKGNAPHHKDIPERFGEPTEISTDVPTYKIPGFEGPQPNRLMLEEVEEYDKGDVKSTIWIMFSPVVWGYVEYIKEWTPDAGFTGRRIDCPTVSPDHADGNTSCVIYAGFLWYAMRNTLYRISMVSGAIETVGSYPVTWSGTPAAAITVSKDGILAIFGGFDGAADRVVLLATSTAGVLRYSKSYTTNGHYGRYPRNCVNDGATALVQFGANNAGEGGIHRIEMISGVVSTERLIINGAVITEDYQELWPAFNVCRNGNIYGLRTVYPGDDFAEHNSQLYKRVPLGNLTSDKLVDMTYPTSSSAINVLSTGAVAMTDIGGIAAINPKLAAILHIDSTGETQQILPTSAILGVSYNVASATPYINGAVGIVVKSPAVYFHAYGTSFREQMASYDLVSGAAQLFTAGMVGSSGYLVETKVKLASHPDPILPPQKQEWEYYAPVNSVNYRE